MELIKPGYTIWGETPCQPSEAIKWIEQAGRTCYKSEDRITEDSAKQFTPAMFKRGHLSVTEHSNFVIRTINKGKFPFGFMQQIFAILGRRNAYHRVVVHDDHIYMNGNLRAWKETLDAVRASNLAMTKEWENLFYCYYQDVIPGLELQDWVGGVFETVTGPNEVPLDLKMITVKFICDRGVSHELVRHRPAAFSQESTRYVDYNGKEMQFIIPPWVDIKPDIYNSFDVPFLLMKGCSHSWVKDCAALESEYRYLREGGWKPEQARSILPNSLKTEVVMTADIPEWKHVFKLRARLAAHPQMQELMIPLKADFERVGWL